MIHIYTGNGKGKTTASTGLIIRGLGADLSGIIVRFIKQESSSEDRILNELEIPVEYFGTGFIKGNVEKHDREEAEKGLKRCRGIILNESFDIMVADEILLAGQMGLIREEEIINLLDIATENIELILTGRNASDKIIEKADLVTEMKEIKHYFNSGVKAREGIEY